MRFIVVSSIVSTMLVSCSQPEPPTGVDGSSESTGADGPPSETSGTSSGDAGTSSGDAGTSSGDAGTSSGDAGTSSGDVGTSSGDVGTSSGDAGTSSTGGGPECGNGIVEEGESCDVGDLAGGTCEALGFGSGVLACDAGCAYDSSGCAPAAPVLALGLSQVKRFDFSWAAVDGADYYQLLESAASGEPYVQLGGDVVGESVSFEMPLHFRVDASYVLRACNAGGCTDSAVVDVAGTLVEAVGYFKASNPGVNDEFGRAVALSADGSTLAVGAAGEASNATGINGDQANDLALYSGAVYVFVRTGLGTWSQQAYVKASNAEAGDLFGHQVELSADGSTLVVSAPYEASNATGIGGNQGNNSFYNAGAVYVFVRDGLGAWSQQAYVKASNTNTADLFGWSLALSADGNTLAAGAINEDSSATGVGGNQLDNLASASGAAYVFVRNGLGVWSQQAYVKASNTDMFDSFGNGVALSDDGDTLAVGASLEDSAASGVGGNQADDSAGESGAVYVFVRDGVGVWSQQAYVKASTADAGDHFGNDVALSGDGETLAVGAYEEDGSATGIDGDQASDVANGSGAAYVLTRSGAAWSQQAYVKASNTGTSDHFGYGVALSGDGDVLVVGAYGESSDATGIGGLQGNSLGFAGAAYVLTRDGLGAWSQAAYVKASNTGSSDYFGSDVAMSDDGSVVVVGAYQEDGGAAGLGGDPTSEATMDAGAVYVY